ncbi:MAG TPA: hypothetical protein VFF33_07915 [Ignavibacteriaceae bacterium]|nr:hypothetical protein [Ignavibacteriaceae bacterium]
MNVPEILNYINNFQGLLGAALGSSITFLIQRNITNKQIRKEWKENIRKDGTRLLGIMISFKTTYNSFLHNRTMDDFEETSSEYIKLQELALTVTEYCLRFRFLLKEEHNILIKIIEKYINEIQKFQYKNAIALTPRFAIFLRKMLSKVNGEDYDVNNFNITSLNKFDLNYNEKSINEIELDKELGIK